MEKEEYVIWGLGCSSLASAFSRSGIRLQSFRHFVHLLKWEESPPARCILLHVGSLRESLASSIRALRRRWPLIDVVVWAPKASGSTVRSAFLAGAKDAILTARAEKVVESVEERIEAQRFLPRMDELSADLQTSSRFEGMVSRSPEMWELFQTCTRVAETDATVLITGETGTGKEMLARAIHRNSGRSGSFVVVNCGAIPEHLIDSELFGYAKGAFTGAIQDNPGLFLHADQGTLLLDELGNIPMEVQMRLLRTLQEGTIRPIGTQEEREVDVRILAATHASLEQMIKEGTFREDLLFRLNVIHMQIPPLRERKEDILFLYAHFMRQLSEHYGISRPELDDGFLDALVAYPWPGNVRQIQHFVERLLLTQANHKLTAAIFRQVIEPFELPAALPPAGAPRPEQAPTMALEEGLRESMLRAERDYLEACLVQCGGHVSQSAQLARISRRSFTRKMKQHDLLRGAYLAKEDAP